METKPTCREHGKMLELHCEKCKGFMCIECLSAHANKNCKHPISILGYAKSELLPKFKEKSENTEEEIKATYETVSEFLTSLKITREGFFNLKIKLEGMLKAINKSLELLEENEKHLAIVKDSIKKNMTNQYEELKRAVESENISHIITKLEQPGVSYVSDGDRQLVEALRKTTDELIAMEKLNSFKDLLYEFNEMYRLFKKKNSLDVQHEYIYGNCYPLKDYTILCRFDIKNQKLEHLLDIPKYSSVIHISEHIFISGGYPYTNQTYEFAEDSLALNAGAPMRYSKFGHAVQAINKNLFVAVGGYQGEYLACCEEYSIAEDKWRELPSLNRPREYAATVFLREGILCAIGGANANNDIEFFTYSGKSEWMILNITDNEANFSDAPKALAISEYEVLIFCGGGSSAVGLWNLRTNSIKNFPGSKLSDHYYSNQAYVRNRKGYILGHYGHVHTFDLDTRQFIELEYASISS